jgi:hypothetical protein
MTCAACREPASPWTTLSVLCRGYFVILLVLAIPSMIARPHAGLDQMLWILNACLLMFAMLVAGVRRGDIAQ